MGATLEQFKIPFREMQLDALMLKPRESRWLFVMAHGAGAGMHHAFLQDMAERLAEVGIATLRFNFPYIQKGRRLPDREAELTCALNVVWDWVRTQEPNMAIIVGGKSMGGRMSSRLLSVRSIEWVRGLVFLGFPLHPAKKPGTSRADHLREVHRPMLFLQGTRDALADGALMADVCVGLGPRAHLHIVEGADHGFDVLRQSGRTSADVRMELTQEILRFCQALSVQPKI
jgi:predicted alpha/beta-hydrolase family hydrolase